MSDDLHASDKIAPKPVEDQGYPMRLIERYGMVGPVPGEDDLVFGLKFAQTKKS